MPPTTRRQSVYSTASSDVASSVIDLTDSPEPAMSTSRQGTKRGTSQREEQESGSSTDGSRRRPKRARRAEGEHGDAIASEAPEASGSASTWRGPGEERENERHSRLGDDIIDLDQVEEVDLTNDGLSDLSTALQRQRADQIASQKPQEEQNKPLRFNTITCVICMDSPTNLTATSCGKKTLDGGRTNLADSYVGHVFCHTCLMEALIAGENRGAPGEAKRSQCPVCRKNISRTKASDILPLVLKKGLATQPRRRAGAATG